MIVSQELIALQTDGAAPPAGDLQWICAADESRVNGPLRKFWSPGTEILSGLLDYTLIDTPDTRYDGMVLVQEYDGFADWPQVGGHWIANFNALAGILMLHGGVAAVKYGLPYSYGSLPNGNTTILNSTVYAGGGTGTTVPVHHLAVADTGLDGEHGLGHRNSDPQISGRRGL